MKQKNRTFLLGLLLLGCYTTLSAQTLKVTQSSDNKKIDRNSGDSIATIIIDSHVKGLTVENDMDDEMLVFNSSNKSQFFIHVDIKKDRENQIDNSSRSLILNSPKSTEYILDTEELFSRQVYYYTVILPTQFTNTFTAEYLFTKSASHGVRLSFGKRFGGYVSYKWGAYKKAGCNIADVHEDYDITRSKELGYIRTAITGGLRLGLIQKDIWKVPFGMHLLVGGGYGEYGRQWSNPMLVDGSSYFYSDYIKGFDGEIAMQLSLYDWLCASFGTELIVGNGKISVDYMIGLGVNLNFDKLEKLKKRK